MIHDLLLLMISADLQQKWFVLDNDTFICFESDKASF